MCEILRLLKDFGQYQNPRNGLDARAKSIDRVYTSEKRSPFVSTTIFKPGKFKFRKLILRFQIKSFDSSINWLDVRHREEDSRNVC